MEIGAAITDSLKERAEGEQVPAGWMRDKTLHRAELRKGRRFSMRWCRERLMEMHESDPEKHPRRQFRVRCADGTKRRVWFTKVEDGAA